MGTFRYQRAGATGFEGVVEASDRSAAVRLLLSRGETPTRIEEVRAVGAVSGGIGVVSARRRVMSRGEMGAFIRELSVATGAGLPLVPALRTIAKQGRSESQSAMLSMLIAEVEHGRSLSDGMQAYGRPFGDLVVSLVRAGESAGRLPEVLTQAATLLERDVKMRRALMGAMLYPAIIAVTVVIAVIVVVTVIVPRVLSSVSGQIAALPLPTRIVQGVAYFFGTYWWLAGLAAAIALFAWSRARSNPSTRLAMDRASLRLPIIGVLIRDVAVARFTRTLGTLVSAGLGVIQSLRITRGTLGNKALEAAIDQVCDEVSAGRTIAEPMERSGYFPPLLVQIINLGERSGKLDEMLTHAAAAFEEKTEQSIKLFTTVLPPLLIVVLAGIVGFVVLSILLPLIELQDAIG